MRIDAKNIDDLFEKSGDHEELLRRLDSIICEETPSLKRQFYSGSSITMIGYGEMPWKSNSSSGLWPVISLAPQKTTVNLYIAADKNGEPLPSYYIKDFGKTAIGKSCLRIRSVRTLNSKEEALRRLLREAVLWADEKENQYGRDCASAL